MVYGNYYENEELLKYIENEVNSKFMGLNITLVYKCHNIEIKMPSNYEIPKNRQQ